MQKPDSGGGYDVSATTPYDTSAMGDMTAMMATIGPFMAVIALIGLAIFVFYIFIWWKIFSKAGHSGALALLNLAVIIPFIGWIVPLVLTIWFAFSEWPALKRANANAGPVQ